MSMGLSHAIDSKPMFLLFSFDLGSGETNGAKRAALTRRHYSCEDT